MSTFVYAIADLIDGLGYVFAVGIALAIMYRANKVRERKGLLYSSGLWAVGIVALVSTWFTRGYLLHAVVGNSPLGFGLATLGFLNLMLTIACLAYAIYLVWNEVDKRNAAQQP